MCSTLSIINIMYFIHGIYSGYTQKVKEFHKVDHHYHNCEKFTVLTGIQLSIVDALMYFPNTPTLWRPFAYGFILRPITKDNDEKSALNLVKWTRKFNIQTIPFISSGICSMYIHKSRLICCVPNNFQSWLIISWIGMIALVILTHEW
jgi:hypothetical protein